MRPRRNLDEGRLIALDKPGQMVRALLESGFRREVEPLPASLDD